MALRGKVVPYERDDHVKVEFPDEATGVAEWMWVRVEVCDDVRKVIIGSLDNEPLNDYEGKVELGSQLVVSCAQIRDRSPRTSLRTRPHCRKHVE